MKMNIRPVTDTEREDYDKSLGRKGALDGRVALEFHEDGHMAVQYLYQDEIDKYGEAYIRTHTRLVYSKFCEEYFAETDHGDWYNDQTRNPPFIVDVEFVEMKTGENTEVWMSKSDDGSQYYLRMLCNEPFAKWMTCGDRTTGWTDRNLIRPNVTFRNGNQTERVYWHDWNETAAYSDTFNPYFRYGDMPGETPVIPDDASLFEKPTIWGDYVLTPVQNAFNQKHSFWLSKKDCLVATYCFSASVVSEVKYQIEQGLPMYVDIFQQRIK